MFLQSAEKPEPRNKTLDDVSISVGTVRNLVCWAIMTPMEGAYGNQKEHAG